MRPTFLPSFNGLLSILPRANWSRSLINTHLHTHIPTKALLVVSNIMLRPIYLLLNLPDHVKYCFSMYLKSMSHPSSHRFRSFSDQASRYIEALVE